MKFILSCGGTAGHINPALAVAGRLRELMPDCEILFIGAEGKMEMELVPREGYEIRPLKITNLSRGRRLEDIKHNFATAKNLLLSRGAAKKLIRDFKPDAVIGTGGYVCYPVLMAAASLGIPSAVHESNAVPGLTTAMLAKHVDRIMVGFEESRAHYPKPEAVIVTGTPVRGEFSRFTMNSAKAELGIALDKKLVLSVWGSLGAGHMNALMGEMLPLMQGQSEFQLVHSAGKMYYAGLKAGLDGQGIDPADCGTILREYIYDMPRVMAAADLIMCRAGASTLAELTYMGKPVIIVPSPNVTNNHQERNARVLENAGGAKVLLEGEFDAAGLLALIRETLRDKAQLKAMSKAMASLAVSDATDRICDIVLDLARRS